MLLRCSTARCSAMKRHTSGTSWQPRGGRRAAETQQHWQAAVPARLVVSGGTQHVVAGSGSPSTRQPAICAACDFAKRRAGWLYPALPQGEFLTTIVEALFGRRGGARDAALGMGMGPSSINTIEADSVDDTSRERRRTFWLSASLLT